MHTIEIPEKGIFRSFPSKVEELSTDEYVFFIEHLLKFESGDYTFSEFKLLLLYKLLGIKYSIKYSLLKDKDRMLVNENLYRISEQLDSFFKKESREGQEYITFDINVTKNLIPVIKGRFWQRRLYGPSEALTDISFIEYKDAHTAFAEYTKSQKDEYLNKLIAALYRPGKVFLFIRKLFPGFNGKSRQIYNPNRPGKLERIGKLPFSLRYGVYVFFAGCENFLRTGKITADDTEISLEVLYKKISGIDEDESGAPGLGLTGILFKLAESGVFGNIKETANQNLYDVLVRLYQNRMEYIEFMRKNRTGHDQGK